MAPYNHKVDTQLRNAWSDVQSAIQRMAFGSDVRPANHRDVFRFVDDPDGLTKFEAGPVVFRVPERPNKFASLYVVVRGWMTLGAPRDGDPRNTTARFGTKVGYFRLKADKLVHVYGAHYDLDEDLFGHPVFHAQLSSQAEL